MVLVFYVPHDFGADAFRFSFQPVAAIWVTVLYMVCCHIDNRQPLKTVTYC